MSKYVRKYYLREKELKLEIKENTKKDNLVEPYFSVSFFVSCIFALDTPGTALVFRGCIVMTCNNNNVGL